MANVLIVETGTGGCFAKNAMGHDQLVPDMLSLFPPPSSGNCRYLHFDTPNMFVLQSLRFLMKTPFILERKL